MHWYQILCNYVLRRSDGDKEVSEVSSQSRCDMITPVTPPRYQILYFETKQQKQ